MRASALLLAALLCLGLAAANVEVKTIAEESGDDGQSSGTYAIVQDGHVVGMMQRYSSGGASPLRREMGRRAGPGDDAPLPPHAARLVGMIRARMDVLAALHDQLVARCPFARHMALARLQAAAAAAGLGIDSASAASADQPLPMRLFGEPEPGQPGEEHPPGGPHHGPGLAMMIRHHLPLGQRLETRDSAAAEEPQPGQLGPFRSRAELEAWRQANPAYPRPGGVREGGRVGRPMEMFTGHPAFPRPMLLREGGVVGRSADQAPTVEGEAVEGGEAVEPLAAVDFGPWAALQDSVELVPQLDPEVDWRVRGDNGGLNWGLLTFLALSAACAAVWGALLAQWCAYCSARTKHAARDCFMTSSDAKLAPLLHEGHLGFDEDAFPIKGGVEYAAAHVPAATQNVTLLNYEPLK